MLVILAARASVLILATLLMSNAWAVPLEEDGPAIQTRELGSAIERRGDPPPNPWVDPALKEPDGDRPAPDRLLLGFQRPPPDGVVDQLRLDGFEPLAFQHVPVVVVTAGLRELPRLLETPGLVGITADRALEWHALPEGSTSNFGGTGDEITRADRARALGYDGSGRTIAVVDTGANGALPHPSLQPFWLGGPLVQNVKVIVGEDLPHSVLPSSPVELYAEGLVSSDLTNGHGTHVSSIAVGAWTEDGQFGGRAPGARLVALSAGDTPTILWMVAAYDWILENRGNHGIRVITNSYGSPGPYHPHSALNIATRTAYESGITVIFSAGNDGPGEGTMNAYAKGPHVISVGATTLSGAVASFSSRGESTGEGKTGPDIVAPGADIVGARNQLVSSTDATMRTPLTDASMVPWEHIPWWRAASGTSQAAAQVAGVAAMVLQAKHALTPDQLKQILQETARPIIGSDPAAQGAGMVDAEAAVLQALGKDIPERDWVEPTVVDQVADTYHYPFHAITPGSPDRGFASRHEHPFPVRLPAEGLQLTFRWEPLNAPETLPQPTALVLTLKTPQGNTVFQQEIESLQDGPKEIGFDLDAEALQGTTRPGWSAGYWTAIVHVQGGLVEYELDAALSYEDGVRPEVTWDPLPPVAPPRVTHDAIEILSDDEFTWENGVVSGSGTEDDPYVIEDWEIDASTGPGIAIGGTGDPAPDGFGTTSHVIIRNVRIHDAVHHCIVLDNAHNVRIEGSQFDRCGIALVAMGGSSRIEITDNEFYRGARGVHVLGVQDLVIRGNHFDRPTSSAIAVEPRPTQRSPLPASSNVLIEGNTLRGNNAQLGVLSPAAHHVTVRDNTFDNGAYVEFGLATHSNRLSESHWVDGTPRVFTDILNVQDPEEAPLNALVDAGSDRIPGTDGRVCFRDARADVGPGLVLVDVVWDFGDAQTVRGEVRACHDYDPMNGPFKARLFATYEDGSGQDFVLMDTAIVG